LKEDNDFNTENGYQLANPNLRNHTEDTSSESLYSQDLNEEYDYSNQLFRQINMVLHTTQAISVINTVLTNFMIY
jgi:hypothetical protein